MADDPVTTAGAPVDDRKSRGAYYTPPEVAAALVRWAVRRPADRLLDPACGDGRFLTEHRRSTGVDRADLAVAAAKRAAPHGVVHAADFFEWAAATNERFECAVGNPPFIRYQRFRGATRRLALRLCEREGAPVSGLTSSWVPYLIVAASLLWRGGRMAFLVPAEIGHAPYAAPLLAFLAARFDAVRVVAIRRKIFPELSEDVWVLYADGYGGGTDALNFAEADSFDPRWGNGTGPPPARPVPLEEWRSFRCRLRPFLLPRQIAAEYRRLLAEPSVRTLGDFAGAGIGYVTGDNDFFHLRPSRAREWDIREAELTPTVRRGRDLRDGPITPSTIAGWRREDRPNFLLRLGAGGPLRPAVRRYLDSDDGLRARNRYKCRVRRPWYSVRGVEAPDFFLPCLSSGQPPLVENRAACACTNAVHAVRLRNGTAAPALRERWDSPLTALSCEIEGHPLGGGVLKLEPREALRVAVPPPDLPSDTAALLREGAEVLRAWRHHG